MSQCHTYTAAPAKGTQPLAWSTTVRLIVIGTPWASPLAAPKLARMSLRTTPSCVSTLSPFDPSAGNGPAVSSGMGAQLAEPPAPVGAGPGAVVAAAVDPDDERVVAAAADQRHQAGAGEQGHGLAPAEATGRRRARGVAALIGHGAPR